MHPLFHRELAHALTADVERAASSAHHRPARTRPRPIAARLRRAPTA